MWTLYFAAVVTFFFYSFFLACSQLSQVGCLPYFHTWCGLNANLECRSKYAARGLLKIQDAKNSQKIRHLHTIAQLCRAVSSQLRHLSTIGKKVVKQQYLLYMSPQYGKLRPTNSWEWLVSFLHPGKFQQVSSLAFVTALTSLNGEQLKFAWCFAISRAGTLFIHFWGLVLPSGILPGGKFTLHPSLAFSYIGSILAVLLNGTRAVDVSQTLRCGTRNGIMELSLLIILIRGRHLYSEGGHHVGHRPTF